jgi:hypothetical protein
LIDRPISLVNVVDPGIAHPSGRSRAVTRKGRLTRGEHLLEDLAGLVVLPGARANLVLGEPMQRLDDQGLCSSPAPTWISGKYRHPTSQKERPQRFDAPGKNAIWVDAG